MSGNGTSDRATYRYLSKKVDDHHLRLYGDGSRDHPGLVADVGTLWAFMERSERRRRNIRRWGWGIAGTVLAGVLTALIVALLQG